VLGSAVPQSSYYWSIAIAETSIPDPAAAVAEVPVWRHRIDLGGGVVTPGTEDTAQELARLRVPARLDGERVLDIGCSDGFYSFECERRGASVIALDDESSLLASGRNGFQAAAAVLGSDVEYRIGDVHELERSDVGLFDTVLFINVLYHLKSPLLALERIASVTAPGGRLILKTYYRNDVRIWFRGRPYGFDIDRRPKWWFFPNTELGGDPTNWFAPNVVALEGALRVSGWTDIERIGTHGDRLYYHARRES
jgi:tRNA (mo5U34)-methyltransferase